MCWRPGSTGDEAAQVTAWIGRTEPISVRTASVISRAWALQSSSHISQAGRSSAESRALEDWTRQESQACMDAAQDALAAAKLPRRMLDEQEPSVVLADHSETKVLIDAAKDFSAHVLVLGSHPGAVAERYRIGSTADALLHCAPLPILLAPRTPKLSKKGLTRVNCAYVDTDQSHEALRAASDLAARWGVPLRLVTFSPKGATMYPTQTPVPEEGSEDPHTLELMVEWREQAQALLDRGKERALARHPELTVHTEAGTGYGWSGAIGALKWKKGDLLVLGSSQLGQFHRVFIGPSTNQIIRHSPVPVLVVPV
ncbi:MAG TPA: universal stress protein [Candidatus Corynebacterium gallistercoris]|uniref:Universal stress protein n=1 Tax=Candidatus Corynebacterium gallistercoris TaxID=2838530 RepID=A0A9D1RZ78_9CORY|nr:universal stress protein [Candidatus Corynebacterium gallistercoris]